MSQFSESQLQQIKARLLPFGAEWTGRTGRPLATVRDGIDFLSSMRGRDDFWEALGPRDGADAFPVDVAALRTVLPTEALTTDRAAEDYLRSVGLSEDEVDAVITSLDESDFFDIAIRSAFAEDRPQRVARALERILDTSSDVLATQCYVGGLSGLRGVGHAIGTMMGIALLLVGTACGPSTPTPPPAQQTAPAPASPTPAPTPAPGNGTPSATLTPQGAPTPEQAPEGEPAPTPEPTPEPPNPAPPPTTRYKGVSPRARRRASKRSASTRGLPA